VLDINADFYSTMIGLINQYGDDIETCNTKISQERQLLINNLNALYADNNTTTEEYTKYCSSNRAALEKFFTENPAFQTTLDSAKAEFTSLANEADSLMTEKGLK